MIRGATLTILLGAATAFAQEIPDRPEKLQFAPIKFETPRARDYKAKLRNGIPAFIAQSGKEGTPLVRVTVSWRGGSYLDPKGKEGLAALFGSQLTQGGTAKLEAAKLEDRLEAMAATLTSSCTDTSCGVSLQVLDKDLAEGLDLLMQALMEPAFAQERLDLAKRQARQRVSRRNDDVTSIAGYQMRGARMILPPWASVANISYTDRSKHMEVEASTPPNSSRLYTAPAQCTSVTGL